MDKAEAKFMTDLKATVDLVTLMAKDSDWPNNPNSKAIPTTPVSVEVKQQMAKAEGVKDPNGFNVQINWFNQSIAELQDIVKSANKFFGEAGWNSKYVVKEYEAHKKKWGQRLRLSPRAYIAASPIST